MTNFSVTTVFGLYVLLESTDLMFVKFSRWAKMLQETYKDYLTIVDIHACRADQVSTGDNRPAKQAKPSRQHRIDYNFTYNTQKTRQAYVAELLCIQDSGSKGGQEAIVDSR